MSAASQTEMAFRVLRLEQQLESYQRLHAEEHAAERHRDQEEQHQHAAFAGLKDLLAKKAGK